MLLKLKSPNVVLKTKDKYCTEDIQIELDESLVNGEVSTLKTLLDATKSAAYLFSGYQGESVEDLIGYNDTENVEDLTELFFASKISTVPLINTRNVKKMDSVFRACINISDYSNLERWNMENVESVYELFCNNSSVRAVPALKNAKKIKNVSCVFQGATNLEDTSNFSNWDISEATSLNCAFSGTGIKTIEFPNTEKVSNIKQMCHNCYELETVKNLNLISLTNNSTYYYNECFAICSKLTSLEIFNIQVGLTINAGNYTAENIIQLCQECINVNESRTLTIGSKNIAKLADVYVKLTGEPEVDETLPKLPMVQCESTDEGAMLIDEYMQLKGWTLA